MVEGGAAGASGTAARVSLGLGQHPLFPFVIRPSGEFLHPLNDPWSSSFLGLEAPQEAWFVCKTGAFLL